MLKKKESLLSEKGQAGASLLDFVAPCGIVCLLTPKQRMETMSNRHWELCEKVGKIASQSSLTPEGIMEGNGKWFNTHVAAHVLWHEHLSCSGSEEGHWSHDSLGYWVIMLLTDEERVVFKTTAAFIEIHERDDGFMTSQWMNLEEKEFRAHELDELCADAEEVEEEDAA